MQYRIWCYGCSHCTMHGVIGTIVALCMASKALSLCHAWCHGRCHCVAVVGVVLRSCLLHGHSGCHCAMLCCGCSCWVVVGVIAPCCVAVAMGVSCHMVLQLQLLHCMVVPWLQSSHHVWCRGHDRRATWCREGVVSGLKKRELAEKEKRKHTSRGKPAQAR